MRWPVVFGLVALGHSAWADDPRANQSTVVPLTDANLVFTPDGKTLTLQYGRFIGSQWLFHVAATAPLDDKSHDAAFTDKNKLIAPFNANLRFGLDTRAARDLVLKASLSAAKTAILRVTGIPREDHFQEFADACKTWTPNPCSAYELLIHVCANDLKENRCKVLQGKVDMASLAAAVVAMLKGRQTKGKTVFELLSANCEPTAKDTLCGTARSVVAWHLETQVAAEQVAALETSLAADGCREADRLFIILKSNDGDAYGKLETVAHDTGAQSCDRKVQAIVLDYDAFSKAVDAQVENRKSYGLTEFDLRDLHLVGMDRQEQTFCSILLDVSGSYDRTDAFADSSATDITTYENYDIQLGLDYTYYSAGRHSWLVDFRGGYEWYQKTLVQQDENTDKPHTVVNVLGTPLSSGYARFALDYTFVGDSAEAKILPGVELRLNVESIGRANQIIGRIGATFTPVNDKTAGRVGIALTIGRTMSDAPELGLKRADWIVIPVAFVGGTSTAASGD